jgi:hypothetical protein
MCHLQQAVTEQQLLSQQPSLPPPTSVEIKATLGLLRTEGIATIVRGHPALTKRSSNCMLLQDVAYRGILEKYTDWHLKIIANHSNRSPLDDGCRD